MNVKNTDFCDRVYTGFLEFEHEEHYFTFFGQTLRIISTSNKACKTEYSSEEIAQQFRKMLERHRVEQDVIIGRCNETNHKIIFLPRKGSYISHKNSVSFIDLDAYIICKYDREKIDCISFEGPEINGIHPTSQAIEYNLHDGDFVNSGTFEVKTKNFDCTTTKEQKFIVDSQTVSVSFGVSRTMSVKNWEPPVKLSSNMQFKLEETNDYRFILRLWYIAKQFIQFLCYRKDVHFDEVKLASPYKDGKHETFATMHVFAETSDSIDTKALKDGRYIKQVYVAGHEGKLLTDIANNNLYLRNLPESYIMGQCIDAARFVMITAAFEWEFDRLYPDGIPKKANSLEAEKQVTKKIEELMNNSTGKMRRIYKSLLRFVSPGPNLANKIKIIGDNYGEIINPFGRQLYSLNNEELDYTEMGSRLADQRNHYAHGDLNKDFIGLSLLDLIFLERIVYVIQLKNCGVDDTNIKNAINELFHCNVL